MKHMAKFVLSTALAISVAAASYGFQGSSPSATKPAPKAAAKIQTTHKKAPTTKQAMHKATHHKSLPTKGTAKHKTHLKPHGQRVAKTVVAKSADKPMIAKAKSVKTTKASTAKAASKATRKGTVQKK